MLLRPYLEQLKKNKISSFETIETRVKIERERERERDLRHGSTIHSRFRTRFDELWFIIDVDRHL